MADAETIQMAGRLQYLAEAMEQNIEDENKRY